jgi:hypothetical protein
VQSKDLLLIANRQAAAVVFPALEDLKSAPLVSPLPHCPNHAHWILGHLIFSEGRYREMTLGIANPCQSFQAQFGGGSKPCPDAKGYPKYEDLLAQLKSMQDDFLAWVDGLTETDLDQLIKDVPPQFQLLFGTWRNALMLRAIHWMQHYGQLTDNRRAAGRPPLIF